MRFVGHHAKEMAKRVLPAPLFRIRRKILKRLADRTREAEKRKAIARHGMFDSGILYDSLRSAGIKQGSVLLVQSSFDRFYNFKGTPVDVIAVLESLVGTDGTLLMPAHTIFDNAGLFVFDARKSPAHTGIICELFRRSPGVVRSLHPTHSVCAKGPLANVLTEDHHKEPLSCGPLSPYAKLMAYDGEILGLGLPPAYTTFLHVVEDMDLADYPRQTYLKKLYDFKVIDNLGKKTELKIRRRDPMQGSSLDLNRVVPHLTPEAHRIFPMAGVPSFWAKAGLLYEQMKRLKEQGIIIYR